MIKNHLNQALTDLSETEEYKILRSEKAEEQIDKIQKKTLIVGKKNNQSTLKRIQSAFI
jgi:hypothetical protein